MKTIEEMIEIMDGYRKGKKLEWKDHYGDWQPIECLNDILLCFQDEDEIRLAPEPKIVPYGPEDLRFLLGRWGLEDGTAGISIITKVDYKSTLSVLIGGNWVSLKRLLEYYLDVTDDPNGVPFGKVSNA